MTLGETAAPSRQRPAPHDPGCAAARAAMGRYLDGSESLATDSELRRHLARCADCNDRFRDALVLAARVGREARQEREAERERLAEQERKAPVSSRFAADPGRAARLRLMLVPAVFVFLMAGFDPSKRSSELELVAVAGETRSGESVLAGGDAERALLRGDWCETGPAAEALIRAPELTLELGADTTLLVESPSRRRFRLERGRLELRGACQVTSPFGVVEVHSGQARLVLSRAGLRVESVSGELSASNAWTRRDLAAGETLVLAHPVR